MMYIEENSFDDLDNLSCLFLHNNMIAMYGPTYTVPTNVFQNLINLKVLSLHANTPDSLLDENANFGEYIDR